MIIRALVKNGTLHPLDPLPPDWAEGRTVELSGSLEPPEDLEEFERRWQELEAVIALTPDDPEDDQRIREAIAEHRRVAKDQMRREMGLE